MSPGFCTRWLFPQGRRTGLALGCLFSSALMSAATPGFAQVAAGAEGHSIHGDVFDEGPRQAARRVEGTGKVHFEVSSKVPDVQAFIDQGIGQLHGYWYYEAERSFRHAAFLDPDCAIAYWGMALANVNNVDRAKKFILKAVEKGEKASPREKRYIDAWKEYYAKSDSKEKDAALNRRKALVKAVESISYDYPEDLEAKALLCALLWENNSKGLPIPSFVAVDALIKDVLRVNPEHPVHHYRIHIWDVEKAKQGLEAAAACGPAAPGIAHMWHMSGHIYSKLKRYDDAAWQQEASARTDHAYMVHDAILPDQIHNYAHNNEWLTRDLILTGRAYDGLAMAKSLIRNPAHPKYNAYDSKKSFGYGRERLCDVLSAFELWDDTLCLADTAFFDATSVEAEQIRRLRMLGRAAWRKGEVQRGCDVLNECVALEKKLNDEKTAAIAKAVDEVKPGPDADKNRKSATDRVESTFKSRMSRLSEVKSELTGYLHLHYRAFDDAKASFAAAGKMDQAFLAHVRFLAGKPDEAIDMLRREVKAHENEVLPQAHLVEMLARAGREEDAKKEFEVLRKVAADLDVRTPIYRRLTDLARGWKIDGDWRIARAPKTDLGPRPSLESLGPHSWTPRVAPDFELAGEGGGKRSLKDGLGRPQILVFSLGAACLHCSEQSQKFADERKKFAAAGLSPVFISTDAVSDLHKAAEAWKGDPLEKGAPYPYPLLSDHGLEAFKAYRCFDDFEGRPLHGTFLVDASGKLQWWDIGPEPFMNVDFLIAESQRLLAIDALLSQTGGQPSAAPCSPPTGTAQSASAPAAE